MYPAEYTWMSVPTPVTTSSITPDSGSSTYHMRIISPVCGPVGARNQSHGIHSIFTPSITCGTQ